MSRSLDQQIVEARPKKADVDPFRPYAFHLEKERGTGGDLDPVATLFLTNRECPFRCTMCDLWKNTTDQTVPLGAIPAQIDYALSRLPQAKHIKLYNIICSKKYNRLCRAENLGEHLGRLLDLPGKKRSPDMAE